MSEAGKKRRRFWQLHLATLIVAVLEMGALLPLNIARYHYVFDDRKVSAFVNERRMSAFEMIFATVLLNALVLIPTVLALEYLIRPLRGPQAISEPDKPMPGWFQIHLSTLVLLIVVLGGFMYMSLAATKDVYGWPYPIYFLDERMKTIPLWKMFQCIYFFVDAFAAFLILYFIYRIAEWLIRHREARKP